MILNAVALRLIVVLFESIEQSRAPICSVNTSLPLYFQRAVIDFPIVTALTSCTFVFVEFNFGLCSVSSVTRPLI